MEAIQYIHASALMAVDKIKPIKLQIQQAVPIRSLSFSPVDGRPHPVSGQDPWLYHPELKYL